MYNLDVALRAASTDYKCAYFGRLLVTLGQVDDFCKHVELHLPKDGKKAGYAQNHGPFGVSMIGHPGLSKF